ncbi:SHOCT domain-containing protein [Mariniplasma anaerobium]|uniref:Uncharacterized protein n=1 Tax=Mariniplasma anaerobium TaxID=2735436 RepID=A0A7U9TH95_9MOLU|nr:SHOCT domain-containing protein [Mariniplasma anaerobium]BCR35202.1 hypothetical protein MPAN_000950 [Mariniplasma anaerobium]
MNELNKDNIFINHKNGNGVLEYLQNQMLGDEKAVFMYAGPSAVLPKLAVGLLLTSKARCFVGVVLKKLVFKSELLISTKASNLLGLITDEKNETYIVFKSDVNSITKTSGQEDKSETYDRIKVVYDIKNDMINKTLQIILSDLILITQDNPTEEEEPSEDGETIQSDSPKTPATTNYISELKELKELLDMDILTKDEFEARKKEILSR